ncbi:MAG: hypothetical protein H7Y04_10850 [Verrucomicrobia bacterium]|nr:hypothetical protein [Cytophagales bacterium]
MKVSFVSALVQKVMLFAFVCVLSSCGDKEESKLNNSVVDLPSNVIGTFTGNLSYTNGSTIIANDDDGKATVTKTGDKTYSITFSDNAPALTNLKFEAASSGSYATSGSDGSTAGMTLSSSNLSIGATKNGASWGFTGTK